VALLAALDAVPPFPSPTKEELSHIQSVVVSIFQEEYEKDQDFFAELDACSDSGSDCQKTVHANNRKNSKKKAPKQGHYRNEQMFADILAHVNQSIAEDDWDEDQAQLYLQMMTEIVDEEMRHTTY
jgi:hypothetical protein